VHAAGVVIALSIETATAVTAIGLLDDVDVFEELVDTERRHTEALAPAAARLLSKHGVEPSGLDAVVVDVGPGLFTGLRVGIAFAKGLSVATRCDLFVVSSTETLAAAAFEAGATGVVLAVVDARRGEVFAARYDVGSLGPTALDDVAVLDPGVLAERLGSSGESVTAVGDGAVRYQAALEAVGVTVRADVVVPSPASALRLVARRAEAGAAGLHHRDVHPTYLREADAVANFAVRSATP
jgi:tRNA threonylcarbamoyladenosine biosynthesis protein TsaB